MLLVAGLWLGTRSGFHDDWICYYTMVSCTRSYS